ncbi:class I SAM-dependent methyltransferase [Marmoricola sp. URHB0036]|uniref:class I SAM-dependent methyltransferase n=1 Tax=Marmoricola sp. URHB0036 TaxID=1298863 RepID=UPI000489AEDB|nr:class I SAM-dependent methyltransferase [Marmoricola sp. URHB0036]
MDLGFRGEVAGFYQRYRRGYPPAVIDVLVDVLGLTPADLVVDLGCGTGQLSIPVARRVGAVLGVDPEPDMLALARRTADEAGVHNTSWMVGSDREVTRLRAVLGQRRVAALTVGQALHWMDHRKLFSSATPMLRPGGGIAVLTNGIPLWLQDSPWSQALRQFLQDWFGTTLQRRCGSDSATQLEYADSLRSAGLVVTESVVEYADELTLEQMIGGVYSALSVTQLPSAERRPAFDQGLADALASHGPLVENVPVAMIIGHVQE